MAVDRDRIVSFLDRTLRTSETKDISRNGLQVEGVDRIRRVGFAVDASLASFRAAVEADCQLLVCHHGLIWDGLRSVRGLTRSRLAFLLQHGLNLYASHLPLDLHPDLGNNIGLCRLLGLTAVRPFGDFGFGGRLPSPLTPDGLLRLVRQRLSADCRHLAFGPDRVRTLAVVSGAGHRELEHAVAEGYDAFLTGEPSHTAYHTAKEAGIHLLFAGHYATETVGLRGLADLVKSRFRIPTVFLDIPTGL